MADIVSDGKTRVSAVPAVANIQAPTTTELNAGLLLQTFITADGLVGLKPDTASVDTSALDSTFNTAVNGRTSFSGTLLRLKRQTPLAGDTAFLTLVRDYGFFLVVRRSIASTTAWASAQLVEVYPALCGEVARVDAEPNTVERYEIPLQMTLAPALRAAVA
jgi:hypothetical protein